MKTFNSYASEVRDGVFKVEVIPEVRNGDFALACLYKMTNNGVQYSLAHKDYVMHRDADKNVDVMTAYVAFQTKVVEYIKKICKNGKPTRKKKFHHDGADKQTTMIVGMNKDGSLHYRMISVYPNNEPIESGRDIPPEELEFFCNCQQSTLTITAELAEVIADWKRGMDYAKANYDPLWLMENGITVNRN